MTNKMSFRTIQCGDIPFAMDRISKPENERNFNLTANSNVGDEQACTPFAAHS